MSDIHCPITISTSDKELINFVFENDFNISSFLDNIDAAEHRNSSVSVWYFGVIVI